MCSGSKPGSESLSVTEEKSRKISPGENLPALAFSYSSVSGLLTALASFCPIPLTFSFLQ